MADTDKVVVTKSKLVAIADAIRAKNSTSDKMSLDSIPDIIANLKTGGDLSETTVELNLANGDQTVSAPKGTGYSKVTISKPATLLPANIASGVEIAGVMGTASVDGTKARLNTPTISWNGSSPTLTITNPSENGNFADGYYIYKDGVKVYTYTSTLGQGTSYSYNMGSIGDNVTAVFTAAIWASDMVESDKPESITYGHYTVTQTLSSHLQTDSAPTSKYHDQSLTETISVAATEGSEHVYLPANIDCTYADGTVPDYTWDPFTGALSIPKVKGKLTITITESNLRLLRPSTLTRKKTVLTWTAVANATTYEIHAFSDSMTDRAIYTGTDLTFDFSSVLTEEGKYTIYVVAKADGFQDSPTTGASRISFHYNPNASFDDVLANNSWEDIAEACSLGMAADLWKVGDEKTVTLTNGKEYTIQIADLTEGRYKTASGDSCHATFIFKNCSESNYHWNTSATNEGGWPSSYMRNTVMKNILALIPSELADFLLSVEITSNGGSRHPAADLASDGDKLFLPSAYEIYGDDPNNFCGWGAGYFNNASYAGETTGGQFGLFATYTSRNDFRRAPLSSPTSYQYWWLRSPYHNGRSTVFLVSSSGDISSYNANSSDRVVPCFAM